MLLSLKLLYLDWSGEVSRYKEFLLSIPLLLSKMKDPSSPGPISSNNISLTSIIRPLACSRLAGRVIPACGLVIVMTAHPVVINSIIIRPFIFWIFDDLVHSVVVAQSGGPDYFRDRVILYFFFPDVVDWVSRSYRSYWI